jgi:hypothetical protein
METSKLGASLRIQLLKQPLADVNVSVRLTSPLEQSELAEFMALGIDGVSAGRRVLFCTVPQQALANIAKHEKVAQVSLVEQLQPKPSK